MCAQTLTWAEANVYRQTAALRRDETQWLEELSLFTLMTWIVTATRMNENPTRLDLPLIQEVLRGEAEAVAERREDHTLGAGPHTPA